ncbi:MAG: glycosyltransferase family 1 protein [Anaerolineae bacterium]|nr:glycosyltransferase family 1 protein [Anaerolineae bacterium]
MMAQDPSLRPLHHLSPEEAQQFFGDECMLADPDSVNPLAGVKRVALFAEAFLPKVDGVSKTAFLTLRYLQRTGREVLVFAPDIAPHSVGRTRVIPLPSVGWHKAPQSRLALPHPLVAQYLTAFKPDLIHLFSPALLSLTGMTVGRQLRVPVVANYQTDLPAYANHYNLHILSHAIKEALRYLHNRCHLTLVPSLWTAKQLGNEGFRRLRRWGRGVNARHFTPARRSAEWRGRLVNGRDPDSLMCIYVGRLANEKRVDLLLEVAKTPGIALTIIGDGGMRGELEAQFAGTNTYFMGALYGDDLAHAYASADVFLFTGVCETFGQVVQEAMASGLPCVIVNQGGITDLVDDGVNGFVCPLDPFALANAAAMLRDDPELRARMAATSRQMAGMNPWEAVMGQLEGHYCEALTLNQRLNRQIPAQTGLLGKII